jgi:hypothetical protein
MRSIAAVDDLILWHAAGILGLAWLAVAAASMDGFLAKTGYAFSTNPPVCVAEHGCDPSMHLSRQLDRR